MHVHVLFPNSKCCLTGCVTCEAPIRFDTGGYMYNCCCICDAILRNLEVPLNRLQNLTRVSLVWRR